MQRFARRRRAAALLEYPLLMGGIAVLALVAIAIAGTRVESLFDTTGEEVASGGAGGAGGASLPSPSPPPSPTPPQPQPPTPPSGTPFLTVSGPASLSYGRTNDGGRDIQALYRVTNTGDGPLTTPITLISPSATILYGNPIGEDYADLFVSTFACGGGLQPGESCFLRLSSNVIDGPGFSAETVSFSIIEANAPSFSVSVSLPAQGETQAYWEGDNFSNGTTPLIASLPDRTSIYSVSLWYVSPTLAPRTLGVFAQNAIGDAFNILSDGCSGQTLTPTGPNTPATCTITYALDDDVPSGSFLLGSFTLPGSGASDIVISAPVP